MTQLKSLQIFFFLLLGVLLQTSCTKGDIAQALAELTPSEAAEIIEGALQQKTGGLDETIKSYAEELVTDISLNDLCAVPYDSTYVFDYLGALTQSFYTIERSHELVCSSLNVPESVDAIFSTDGTYSTQRIDSEDSSLFTIAVSGLQPSVTLMLLNGSYSRTGTQEIGNTKTLNVTSVLEMTLTDIEIDKSTYEIISGTASISLSGTTQDTAFSYTGTLTFNGSDMATVLIDEERYEIDLS